MITSSPHDRLEAIAEHPAFIAGAYFIAFFPWGMMSNIDFISEKWRTIKRTRQLARWHMWCSILPMIYVGVYAEAQRRKGDWKECCAAIVALGNNLTHFLRTLVGSTQLNAFVTWCTDTIECMRIVQGGDVAGDANKKPLWGVAEALTFWRKWIRNRNDGDEGSESYSSEGGLELDTESYNSEAEVEVDILDKLMVNNTIVDNELEGTEVAVNISWRKVWDGLKKREWKPSSWLETESTSLCSVRWICAFLCALGEDWRVGGAEEDLSAVTRASFYSDDVKLPLRILQDVTYNIGATENKDLTFSVSDLLNGCEKSIDLPETAAYGNDLRGYIWRKCFTSYTLEFDGLRTSYPSRNAGIIPTNRENISVELMDSVVIAKHMGFEKLRAMRRCFDRLGPRTDKMWRNSWCLLLEQCGALPSDDSPLWQIFNDLNKIPLFPYRLQMLSLWEESTNWRVLQASAHQDNTFSYRFTSSVGVSLFEIEPRPPCVFEYCREIGLSEWSEPGFFSGVVLETVRSILANWLFSSSRIPDWKPVISTASIELPMSRMICGPRMLDLNRDISCESIELPLSAWSSARSTIFIRNNHLLIWECQRGLQIKLARRTNLLDDITAEKEIIMLLLLGLPSMYTEVLRDAATINLDGDGDGGKCRVWSKLAPQNVCIKIRVNEDASKMWLNLVDNTQSGRFMWQEWINAAMGYMKGVDEKRAMIRADNKRKAQTRTIRKADLRKPIVELLTYLEISETDSENGTGTAQVSTECSTVDGLSFSDYVVDIERSETGSENGIGQVSAGCSVLDVSPSSDTVVDAESSKNGWENRTARIWTGWPVFDVRVCKFEIDQWLARCRLDLENIEKAFDKERIDYEIETTKEVIWAMVAKIDDNA